MAYAVIKKTTDTYNDSMVKTSHSALVGIIVSHILASQVKTATVVQIWYVWQMTGSLPDGPTLDSYMFVWPECRW